MWNAQSQGPLVGGGEGKGGVSSSGDGGDGGGGSGAFAEGGLVAGPISLLGYLRVEVFGAEDHGVVDTQVGLWCVGTAAGLSYHSSIANVELLRAVSRVWPILVLEKS